MAKRTPVATLSRQERASLAVAPRDARLLYLLFMRPNANRKGIVSMSEQALADNMTDLHPNGELCFERVRAVLDSLVARKLISATYAEQSYRLIEGVH